MSACGQGNQKQKLHECKAFLSSSFRTTNNLFEINIIWQRQINTIWNERICEKQIQKYRVNHEHKLTLIARHL